MSGVLGPRRCWTLFIGDIDASAAEGTVRFGLDGMDYEIDLNPSMPSSCGRPGNVCEGGQADRW